SQLDWYTQRVDAARQTIEHHYAAEHSLSALARGAAMSPFHFARVFRELTGVPPHRYLVHVRLTAAAAALREGASVTDTCFAVGFRNLSHFIHAFRQAYGLTPSAFARSARRI